MSHYHSQHKLHRSVKQYVTNTVLNIILKGLPHTFTALAGELVELSSNVYKLIECPSLHTANFPKRKSTKLKGVNKRFAAQILI